MRFECIQQGVGLAEDKRDQTKIVKTPALLYHGTECQLLRYIVLDGIKPDASKRGMRGQSGHVYVTPSIERAAYFAKMVDGDAAIVVVDGTTLTQSRLSNDDEDGHAQYSYRGTIPYYAIGEVLVPKSLVPWLKHSASNVVKVGGKSWVRIHRDQVLHALYPILNPGTAPHNKELWDGLVLEGARANDEVSIDQVDGLTGLPKIDAFFAAAMRRGLRFVLPEHPEAYSTSRSRYPTLLTKDGDVKVAISGQDIYSRDGVVYMGSPDYRLPDARIIHAIVTVPGARRSGKASMVMGILNAAADESNIRLRLEPVEMKGETPKGVKQKLTTKQLKAWYGRHGFEPEDKYASVMERKPKRPESAD